MEEILSIRREMTSLPSRPDLSTISQISTAHIIKTTSLRDSTHKQLGLFKDAQTVKTAATTNLNNVSLTPSRCGECYRWFSTHNELIMVSLATFSWSHRSYSSYILAREISSPGGHPLPGCCMLENFQNSWRHAHPHGVW